MSLRSALRSALRPALRSRVLRATGSLALVAVLAVPAMPGAAAADELEPTPATTGAAEQSEQSEETEPVEPVEQVEPGPVEPVEPGSDEPRTTPEPEAEPAPEPDAALQQEPVEPVEPALAGPGCRGGAFGTESLGGAVNPLDGSRWVATTTAVGRLLMSRDLGDGTTTPPLVTIELPGAPGVAGGLTFGTDGRLHVVAAADGGGDAVLYRTALPLRPGARPVTADEVSRTRTDGPVTRIAFDRTGLLHLVQDGFSDAVDPVTGEPVARYDAAAGQQLACGRPGRLTVRVDLPRGRAADTDQLAVTLTGGAYDGSPGGSAAPVGVTAGADQGVQARRGEYVQVVTRPGTTHDVTLTAADGSEPTAYDVTLECLDDTTRLLTAEAVSGTLTLPAESAAVTCTFAAVPAALPAPDAGSEPPGGSRALGLRPSMRSMSADNPLGGGIGTDREPGTGGGRQPDRTGQEDRDPSGAADDTDPAGAQDGGLGRDLGAQMRQDGALGGGIGGAMPGMSDPEAGVQQPRTTANRGPNLPNTGGPPAVVLPLALGVIVVGSVLLTRRRSADGRHRS